MPTKKPTALRCKECRDGEHENYDDDVRLVMVRDPNTRGKVMRAFLCGEHRDAREDDGYLVEILNR